MPFDGGNCGKQQSQFIEIARCQNSTILPINADVFPMKVMHNREENIFIKISFIVINHN